MIVLLLTPECKFPRSDLFYGTDDGSSLQEVFGGNAASDEYHIARHVANLFVVQTYEGQSDIHGKYIAPNDVGPRLILSDSIDSGSCDHRRTGLCVNRSTRIDIPYANVHQYPNSPSQYRVTVWSSQVLPFWDKAFHFHT